MSGSRGLSRWLILGGVCSALTTGLTLYWGESSWRDLTEALAHMRASQVILITAASGVTLILRSLRLCVLFTSLDLRGALAICATHNALTRLLPARSGELSLPLSLKAYTGASHAEGALTLLWLRLTEVLCLGVITSGVALSLYSRGGSGDDLPIDALSVMIIGSLSLLAGVALQHARAGLTHMIRLASSIPRFSAPLLRIEGQLSNAPRLRVDQGVRVGLYTALILINQAWLFSLILSSVGADLSFAWVLLGSVVVHLAGVLPAPTIGNVGTHELGWTLTYAQLGVSSASAGASALLSQWLTLALALVWWVSLGAQSTQK